MKALCEQSGTRMGKSDLLDSLDKIIQRGILPKVEAP